MERYNQNTIGFIETCFKERFGTPRQPSLAPSSWGVLRFRKVDFESGFVTFHRSALANGRRIQLSPKLSEFLRSHPRISDHVFLNEGSPWLQGKFRKILARHRAQVDLERDWDSFAFRHTFAYHFLRKGKTLQQLQVVLGHRNIADTLIAYGSIVSRDVEKVSPY